MSTARWGWGEREKVKETKRTSLWGADTFFFYLSKRQRDKKTKRQRALLVEVGGRGKKSMRQRELLVEGLTHFVLFVSEAKRTSLWGADTFFLLCQQDNKHCSLRLGGEWKKSMRQRGLLFEGLTHFFSFINEAMRTACWGADAFFLLVNKTNRTSYWGMTENYFTQSTHLVQSLYI